MGHSNLNVDYSLKMWNLFDFTNPVHSFIGHTDSSKYIKTKNIILIMNSYFI